METLGKKNNRKGVKAHRETDENKMHLKKKQLPLESLWDNGLNVRL